MKEVLISISNQLCIQNYVKQTELLTNVELLSSIGSIHSF